MHCKMDDSVKVYKTASPWTAIIGLGTVVLKISLAFTPLGQAFSLMSCWT